MEYSTFDAQYKNLVRKILDEGQVVENRTGTSAITVPATNMIVDCSKHFPLLSIKKIKYSNVLHELLWFYSLIDNPYKCTHIKYLVDNGCNIWNEDAFRYWMKFEFDVEQTEFNKIRSEEPNKLQFYRDIFNKRLSEGDEIAGDLGHVYGKLYKLDDAMDTLLHNLEHNPTNRRLIVDIWNHAVIDSKTIPYALPPCHTMWQLMPIGDTLHMSFYMRSTDVFLGLPYNIASYATLLLMLCETYGYKPGNLYYNGSNSHIYLNHVNACETLLERDVMFEKLPTLAISKQEEFRKYRAEHFELLDYKPQGFIKANIVV